MDKVSREAIASSLEGKYGYRVKTSHFEVAPCVPTTKYLFLADAYKELKVNVVPMSDDSLKQVLEKLDGILEVSSVKIAENIKKMIAREVEADKNEITALEKDAIAESMQLDFEKVYRHRTNLVAQAVKQIRITNKFGFLSEANMICFRIARGAEAEAFAALGA